MDESDEIFDRVLRDMKRATPFFKCRFCHADIILTDPRSTLGCDYLADSEFEKRLQTQQRNSLIPCTDLWYANQSKFKNVCIRVVCYKRCQRPQDRKAGQVEWFPEPIRGEG